MKQIGLIDGDKTKYPNIALMKISSFWKKRGANVEWALAFGKYDKCYCSRVFSFSTHNDDLINILDPDCGGTGFEIESKLPKEIEDVRELDYSLYPKSEISVQFYSRGCIRKCPFCVVSKKEGYIYPVEPMSINPNAKYIDVLDNNFFANPEWKFAVEDLKKTKLPIKLSGVDARIITEEQSYELSKMKLHNGVHIAWDFPKVNIMDGIKTMTKFIKPYKITCYVLVGYNSTIEEDLHRINQLQELGITPFVMPFREYGSKKEPPQYAKDMARWCNMVSVRKSCKFEDYEPRKGFRCKQYFL